ncbi:hypothetical protein [Saccharopolyspora tripterygii]
MTDFDHYREAERLLRRADAASPSDDTSPTIARAQVHATLSLAETNTKATTTAAQPRSLPDWQIELVTGLRALVEMFEANPQIIETNRYTFRSINVPLNTSADPRADLQATVTAALAHGATPERFDSGEYVGVKLSWGSQVKLYLYDRPEKLGDVASLLPGGTDVEAVDA